MFEKFFSFFFAGSKPAGATQKVAGVEPEPKGLVLPSTLARWKELVAGPTGRLNAANAAREAAEKELGVRLAAASTPEAELEQRRRKAALKDSIKESCAARDAAWKEIEGAISLLRKEEGDRLMASPAIIEGPWGSWRDAGRAACCRHRRRVVFLEGSIVLLNEEETRPCRRVNERILKIPDMVHQQMVDQLVWDIYPTEPSGSVRVDWATKSPSQLSTEELEAIERFQSSK